MQTREVLGPEKIKCLRLHFLKLKKELYVRILHVLGQIPKICITFTFFPQRSTNTD